jgi:hypothetical protein
MGVRWLSHLKAAAALLQVFLSMACVSSGAILCWWRTHLVQGNHVSGLVYDVWHASINVALQEGIVVCAERLWPAGGRKEAA